VPGQRTARTGDKSATSAQLRDSVEIVPQRFFPLTDLLLVQLLVVAGMVAARPLGFRRWHAAALGLAIAGLLLVRIRGKTLPQWAALGLGYVRERRNRFPGAAVPEPFDAEISGGPHIGFQWDGNTLLSLLKIEQNPQAMTVMEPGMTVSGDMLPIHLVADCLHQFDITLESIDVISQGARSHGHSPIAAVYDGVLGPLPAIAARVVWVALRFNPSQCADAVRRRGGGREGIVRTAATATRRVAHRLIEAGLRPRVMTSSEITQATRRLSDGVNLRTVEQTWLACRHGSLQLRTFLMRASMLTTSGVGLLWTIPSYSTTVCISLRHDQRRDLVKIRGLARFDTHGGSRIDLPGLEQLSGRQFSALVSTLPVPQPKRPVRAWAFGTGKTAFENLALPASGCGQVIGADSEGRAVALTLFGPQIRQVDICAGPHLAQQVLLRSLALGARVRVHTNRPAAWRGMADRIGDRSLLGVAGSSRGSIQAGSDRNYSVEVFDGVAPESVRVGVTTMVLHQPSAMPSANFDVALEALDDAAGTVRVSTHTRSSVVTMVATDEELHYITAPSSTTGHTARRRSRPIYAHP
jgi:type VII secretion protein EccE